MYEQSSDSPTPTNPLQAASEIFYKPAGVFTALVTKNNWSWIPFLLLSVILFIPPYLYFSLVDFDWWLNTAIAPTLVDMAPSQQENVLSQYTASRMQLTVAISSSVLLIILYALKAFFFSMVTRNDDKGVQGFTDWYGAMWWMAMPMLVNALASLVLLALKTPGSQIESSILTPLSLGFLSGVDMASPWFNLLIDIRLDVIWTIILGYICLRAWTNFSQIKALATAIFPAAFLWTILIITGLST